MDGIRNITSGQSSVAAPLFNAPATAASPVPSREEPALLTEINLDLEAITIRLFDRNDDKAVDERDSVEQFQRMARQFEQQSSHGAQLRREASARQQDIRERYEQENARRTTLTTAPQGAVNEAGKGEKAVVSAEQSGQSKSSPIKEKLIDLRV